MKTLSAASIGQYEKAVDSLEDYHHTLTLGLHVCLELGEFKSKVKPRPTNNTDRILAIVFGSDQGLVGRFNDVVADFAIKSFKTMKSSPKIFAIGKRLEERLTSDQLKLTKSFAVPDCIAGVTSLAGQILIACDKFLAGEEDAEMHLFFNSPQPGAGYICNSQRLLPLDDLWRQRFLKVSWPSKMRPEILGSLEVTLRALIREYLFVSIFKACAHSLAAENASRLAAMQRADKNIEDLLKSLNVKFHRLRQSLIDEELFDVIAGCEALTADR
jgi:F-type H+-transporting ATPase subunit gamma